MNQSIAQIDIVAYLKEQENKQTLRFITCGSVDDGKSTLIGRLLYESKNIFDDQLQSLESESRQYGTQGEKLDLALSNNVEEKNIIWNYSLQGENPEIVKENIKNKFQDSKLPLVDEVITLDEQNRGVKQEGDALRAERNKLSKQIGALMGQGKKEEAEEMKKKVTDASDHLAQLEEKEKDLARQPKSFQSAL